MSVSVVYFNGHVKCEILENWRSYDSRAINPLAWKLLILMLIFLIIQSDVMCMFATGQMEREIFQELGGR